MNLDALNQRVLASPTSLAPRRALANVARTTFPAAAAFVDAHIALSCHVEGVREPSLMDGLDRRGRELRGALPHPAVDPRVHGRVAALLSPDEDTLGDALSVRLQFGWAASLRLAPSASLEAADAICARWPIRHVQASEAALDGLEHRPWSSQLATLSLHTTGLDDARLLELARLDVFSGLRMLDVRRNALTNASIEALAREGLLPSLDVLLVDGNQCDPLAPDLWVDQGEVIGWTDSEFAQHLERAYGARSWFDPHHASCTEPLRFR